MSLTLRVRMITPSGVGATKAMRFAENMSAFDAAKLIEEKSAMGGKDHGIFIPLNETSGTLGGRWMKPERTLEHYDLSANQLVEYRKKHDAIKVVLIDGTQKTCMVDMSADVGETVGVIAQKIGLKAHEEYSLKPEKSDNWMDSDKSLLEQMHDEKDCVRLAKKFYVSDTNVDRDDPVHLHFVYAQSKDDVMSGKLVTTRDEAVMIGAILCQVDFGTMSALSQPNLKTSCAERWHKDKDMARLIGIEWKKLAGMNDVNAKFRFIQFCRSLKTYGITLFMVKEADNKKKGKLLQKMIGFTRDSIIRMSADCKVVEKTWPIRHLKRWAAAGETFTLDFGAHEDGYLTLYTQQGEEMSKLISGYIDLLLKRQQNTEVVIEDDGGQSANVESMGKIAGSAMMGMTMTSIGDMNQSLSMGVHDVDTAKNAVEKMINQLFGEIAMEEGGSGLSGAQRLQQLADHEKNLGALASRLLGIVNDPRGIDKQALNAASKDAANLLEMLVKSARTACAMGLDPDGQLFEGVKGLAESLQGLLTCAGEVAKNPNDQAARNRLADAHTAVEAQLMKLRALEKGARADDAFQRLLTEMGKSANAAAQRLAAVGNGAGLGNEAARPQVQMAVGELQRAGGHLETLANILAPAATDESCKGQVLSAADRLRQAAEFLKQSLQAGGLSPDDTAALHAAMANLTGVLGQLLSTTEIPVMAGSVKGAGEFSANAHLILEMCTALMASLGQGSVIKNSTATIMAALPKLQQAVVVLGDSQDLQTAARLRHYADNVRMAADELNTVAPASAAAPSDEVKHAQLRQAAQRVADATNTLTGDAGDSVAVAALFDAAKYAAATGTALVSASYGSAGKISDPNSEAALLGASATVADAAAALLDVLKTIYDANDPRSASVLVNAAEAFAPRAYKLIAAAKQTAVKVTDPNAKRELAHSADLAAKAIHKLLLHRKGIKAAAGAGDMVIATEHLGASLAEIDGALLSVAAGMLDPATVSREVALKNLNGAVKGMATLTKEMSIVARDSPEALGPMLVRVAAGVATVVAAAKELAATADDPQVAKAILMAAKRLVEETNRVAGTARALASKPNDDNLNKLLAEAGREVAQSLAGLVQASRAVIPKQIQTQQQKAGDNMEALAEKELQGCAATITAAVERLKAAQAAARERAKAADFNIDEGAITEAILEACHAIGMATGTLIGAATAVQSEFNLLMGAPETASVYKRDPKWAKGLISASHEVAASVQYLVNVADNAAKGESVEEALQVAASQVSSATAHLVAASSVKTGVAAGTQSKLMDASRAVTNATKGLVQAAKDAANFRDEQAAQVPSGEEFNLSQSKIAEMEAQMEILKMERELERKRQMLLNTRKAGYADAGKADAPASPQAGAPQGGAPAPKRMMGGPGGPGAPPKRGMAPPKRGMPPPKRGMAPKAGFGGPTDGASLPPPLS